jgi:ABC-2 type transport system ATP-binding protein
MDDIEALCSRVVVIDQGRITCDGSLDDLRARVGVERRITVDLEDEMPIELEGVTVVRQEGCRVVLAFDPRQTPPAAVVARITQQHAVRDLFIENPPIEEIVSRLYDATRERAP